MSEYERLGPEQFWNFYGESINAVHSNLVLPVLMPLPTTFNKNELGFGKSGYTFEISGRGEFYVRLDVEFPAVEPLVKISLYKKGIDECIFIGDVQVQFPCSDLELFQEPFRALIPNE